MFSKLRTLIADAFDSSVFVIRIADGSVTASKGRVPLQFLAELRELVTRNEIARGVIRGQRRETYVRLAFSRDIPPDLHQRLRNIWHVYEPMFQTSAP